MDGSHPASVLDLAHLGDSPSVVLVRPVQVRQGLLDGFREGPMPFALPANATTAARDARPATTAEARRTLVASQQGDVLYGGAGTRRQHRMLRTDEILGVEVFSGPAPSDGSNVDSFVAVHACAGGGFAEHLDFVAQHAARSKGSSSWWHDVIATESTFRLGVIRRISYHSVEKSIASEDAALAAYAMVSAAPADRLNDLRSRALRRDFTIARPDWSALILRDGGAFIAHQQSSEPFAPSLRAFVHSIHLDALLFALLQRRLVDVSGDAAVKASLTVPSDLAELERSHFDFKRRYWRTSLTDKRTSPSDEVLRAFQAELLTPLDVADVEERVQEGARVVRTMHAEQLAADQARLNRNVEDASVVIGAFLFVYTAAAVIREPSWELFAFATAIGIAGMLVAFAFLKWSRGRVDTGKSGEVSPAERPAQ